MPTIAHISDLHLQSGVPARQAQVEPILHKINQLNPDLVVISGDITDDGWDSLQELQWAKSWLNDRITNPWHAVAGNHDVGNFLTLPDGVIDRVQWEQWFNTFGGCTRLFAGDLWQIHFVTSMLFGSGLEYEQIQDDWLTQRLQLDRNGDIFTVLSLHTPLFIDSFDESSQPARDYWLGPIQPRLKVLSRMQNSQTRLVCSGHVHQSRIQDIEGIRFAWAPPASGTWVHAPELPNPPMPEKTGFFLHTLHDDGRVDSELIECAPMLKQVEFNPWP